MIFSFSFKINLFCNILSCISLPQIPELFTNLWRGNTCHRIWLNMSSHLRRGVLLGIAVDWWIPLLLVFNYILWQCTEQLQISESKAFYRLLLFSFCFPLNEHQSKIHISGQSKQEFLTFFIWKNNVLSFSSTTFWCLFFLLWLMSTFAGFCAQ